MLIAEPSLTESAGNPKLASQRNQRPRTGWYFYYAGYAPDFVATTIDRLELGPGAVVLDPWNGAGTTTQLARDKGCSPLGFDINPAMVVVAKARLLHSNVKESLASLCVDIVRKAESTTKRKPATDEPLGRWLTPFTAHAFRRIELAIGELLISDPNKRILARQSSLDFVSSLAAFFYTALFRTTRRSLRRFQSSNPTWIKKAPSIADLVSLDSAQVFDSFKSSCLEMIADMRNDRTDHTDASCRVDIASSTSLPLEPGSADAVITSPPYCTRIDYAVATWPELAVLGANESYVDTLRRRMLGTTTVCTKAPEPRTTWGNRCTATLDLVAGHPSKASNSYYLRNMSQYFDALDTSLSEISRVLRSKAHLVLVAQDSYYKDIHVDLPAIITEMALAHGLNSTSRHNFPINRTRAAVNTRAQKYRPIATAVESVLSFTKP